MRLRNLLTHVIEEREEGMVPIWKWEFGRQEATIEDVRGIMYGKLLQWVHTPTGAMGATVVDHREEATSFGDMVDWLEDRILKRFPSEVEGILTFRRVPALERVVFGEDLPVVGVRRELYLEPFDLMNHIIPCDTLLEDGILPGWRWGGYDFDLLIRPIERGWKGELWERLGTRRFEVEDSSREGVVNRLEGLLREHFPGVLGGRPALERVCGDSWVV